MEKFEYVTSENCYICDDIMDSYKSDLTIASGFSEKPIFQLIETFTNTCIPEDIINASGVCINCYVKLNEFDEHQAKAEQISCELVELMNNKYVLYEEGFDINKVKQENERDQTHEEIIEAIEFEPFEEGQYATMAEEGLEEETGDSLVEGIDGYHFEIIVDDTKENVKKETKATFSRSKFKAETGNEFVVVQLEDNSRAYQCETCFKTFKDKSKLRSHREIHTDERNIICPDCGKAFKTMNCLRNHKRLHVPDRTYYNCDQCEKKYTQKIQLKKHIEIVHMQRRDFVCTTCGASFGTNSVLKMHLLSHQDFRAECCDVCGFRFHTKAKLRRHMKSHTGERNYQCNICCKKFLYSYNVVAHIRNVHEKRKKRDAMLFHCRFCTDKFEVPEQLDEHMEECHSGLYEVVE
ncbi:CLUMA_CG011708, isoform A [Clunio marinus]|uniref:CLUMA_CG011708, isoform A n=1 Tax=Clunio marinus TaxID=568069 RepID=A0A1J1IFN1_9DIPT|nr:CLUMA_CG011708, isoform A [Clunio marinus]